MPYKDPERQAKAQREWCAKRRAKWLTENGPCVRCGRATDLQVDHRDPGKKISHRIWSWAPARLAAELAKCQVLCGVCHRGKTAFEQRGEKNKTAKLTEADVRTMHARAATGEPGLSIAKAFGISHRQAYRILKGERWAHVYADIHGREAVA